MDCNIFIIEFYNKERQRKTLPLMNEGLGELRVSETLFISEKEGASLHN